MYVLYILKLPFFFEFIYREMMGVFISVPCLSSLVVPQILVNIEMAEHIFLMCVFVCFGNKEEFVNLCGFIRGDLPF